MTDTAEDELREAIDKLEKWIIEQKQYVNESSTERHRRVAAEFTDTLTNAEPRPPIHEELIDHLNQETEGTK